MFLIVYVIIHAIVCFIIYFGTRARVFKFSEQLMPIIFFVPVWGIIVGIAADYNSRRNKTGTSEIGLEDMHAALDDYRLLKIDEDTDDAAVVPLEEAMTINDIEVRRKMLTDILHRNPNEYIRLLQEARLNDDIEVTHYASTAIMEIQREYELELQKTEKIYNEHPEEENSFENYIEALSKYINSGLIAENLLFIYRKRYAELLEVQIKQSPERKSAYLDAVDNHLIVGDYGSAGRLTNLLITKWPEDEKSWLARLKLCQQINDGATLKATIAEIKRRNVYLSPEGKSILSFWDQDKGEHTA